MAKPYRVTITFQVTEEVSIDAVSPDEAIRRAIEVIRDGDRFVDASVKSPNED